MGVAAHLTMRRRGVRIDRPVNQRRRRTYCPYRPDPLLDDETGCKEEEQHERRPTAAAPRPPSPDAHHAANGITTAGSSHRARPRTPTPTPLPTPVHAGGADLSKGQGQVVVAAAAQRQQSQVQQRRRAQSHGGGGRGGCGLDGVGWVVVRQKGCVGWEIIDPDARSIPT